jgi:hypothetical protein
VTFLLLKQLQGFLEKYPGWGYTAVATDTKKKGLVHTTVCDALTDLCSEFKQVVSQCINMIVCSSFIVDSPFRSAKPVDSILTSKLAISLLYARRSSR